MAAGEAASLLERWEILPVGLRIAPRRSCHGGSTLLHGYGCTQAELAKRSNVSLRSIQMYEQRNKDINKASAETVLSLAKVLGCTMEDLLET